MARLYYVDSPEAETAYRDRLDEQAGYLGITRVQGTQIAHETSVFNSHDARRTFHRLDAAR